MEEGDPEAESLAGGVEVEKLAAADAEVSAGGRKKLVDVVLE